MKQRHAFTLLELAVAAAIVAVLLATSLKMLHSLSDFEHSAERRAFANDAIAAAAEQIGNLPWDQLTTESANQVGIPPQIESFLPSAKLTVAVEEESAPVAKRIMVNLTWNDPHGRAVAPICLTTWSFPHDLNQH